MQAREQTERDRVEREQGSGAKTTTCLPFPTATVLATCYDSLAGGPSCSDPFSLIPHVLLSRLYQLLGVALKVAEAGLSLELTRTG